jgi:hypothetical protein
VSRHDQNQPSPEELLAAYAAGALEGEEAAAVEELMAADPSARAEMEALREVVLAARQAQPRPEREPAWDEMAREIAAECDRQPARARREGLLQVLLRPLRRPRYIGAAACAVAAAAALLLVLRGGSPADDPAMQPDPARTAAAEATIDAGANGALRATELEELDATELEELLTELALLEEIDSADALLPQEVVAEWVGLEIAEDRENGLGPAPEPELFAEPNYENWLENLAEAEIDALAAYLDEIQAG